MISDTALLATTAAFLGAALLLMTWIISRVVVRRRMQASDRSLTTPTLTPLHEAVIVARPQGKVIFANSPARQLFGANGSTPSLAQMAARVEPVNAFYELFTAEGQTHLRIADLSIEASSVRLTTPDDPLYVISLRKTGAIADLADGSARNTLTAAALTEIGKFISATLELDDTLTNILTVVGRILPYQVAELALWDADRGMLEVRQRSGEPAYVNALNQQIAPLHHAHPQFVAWWADPAAPLLLNNLEARTELFSREDLPFASLLALPLRAAGDLVGVLVLVDTDPEAYLEDDLELADIIATQAAIAIRNAQLYARQQRSLDELRGLVSIAQTASLISDPQELISRLTERIASLVNVEICGFLLHDDASQMLVAQTPFLGLPASFTALYRFPANGENPLAQIFHANESWFTNEMRPDDPLIAGGFGNLARAAGIHTNLITPLIAGGRHTGLLQVSNKRNNGHFSDGDVRLVQVLAGQAAALLDNARLIREASQRASRSEGARLLADITASARNVDNMLHQSLELIVSLVGAEYGVIFLLDPYSGDIIPHQSSAVGLRRFPEDNAILSASDPGYIHTVTQTRRSFFTHHASTDRRITAMYTRIQQFYEVESAIVVPMVVEDRSMGELWLGSSRTYGLNPADVELAEISAAQIASALIRTELTARTDADLRQRADQLTGLTRIARILNQTLDLNTILSVVIQEVEHAARALVSIVIVQRDINGQIVGDPQRMGVVPSSTPLTPTEREVLRTGKRQLLSDVPAADRLLSDTGSALIVPINSQGETVGLIHLFHSQRGAFSGPVQDFAIILAEQAGIAIGNAQRYREQLERSELLRRRADQAAQLLAISRNIRSDRPLPESLEAIALGIQDSIGFSEVRISQYLPEHNVARQIATAGVALSTVSQQADVPWHTLTPYFTSTYRRGDAFFVPADAAAPTPRTHWLPDDRLLLPLYGSGGEILGLIEVSSPRDGQVPTTETIKSLEIFANQAALAIENALLFESAQQHALELTEKLAELQNSYAELDRVNRSMQHKDRDLREALAQRDRRANLLLNLIGITSQISGLRSLSETFQTITTAVHEQLDFEVALFFQTTPEGIRLQAGTGFDPGLNILALLPQHNPVQHVLTENLPILIEDVERSGWRTSPLLNVLNLKAVIAVPVRWAGITGCLLAGSTTRSERAITSELLDIFNLLASNLGITLENVSLYREIQELQDLNQSVLQSIDQGLIVLSTNLAVLLANQAAASLLPANTPDRWVGKSLFTLAPGLLSHDLEHKLTVTVDRGEPFEGLTIDYVSTDQTRREIIVAGYALRQRGKITGAVLLLNDQSERAELERTARERSLQLEALTKVSRVISSALRVEDVVALVLDQLDRVIPFDSAMLWLQSGKQLRLMASRGPEEDTPQAGLTVKLSDSPLYNEIVRLQQALVVDDTTADPNFVAQTSQTYRSWLGVPLISKDEVLGTLTLEKAEAGYYRQHHIEIVQAFANQAAVAFDNARLFEESWQRAVELNERSQRLAHLTTASAELGSTLDLEQLIAAGLTASASALQTNRAQAIIFDEISGLATVRAEYNLRNRLLNYPETPIVTRLDDQPLIDNLMARRQPIVAEDVAAIPQVAHFCRQVGAHDALSALFVPLVTSDRTLGMLALYDVNVPRAFPAADIDLARTIANQLAIAYQNAAHFQETKQQLSELETLYRISQSISTTIDMPQMLRDLRTSLVETLHARSLYLAIFHADTQEMSFPIFIENNASLDIPRQPLAGLTGHIIRTRQPLLISGANTAEIIETLGALHTGVPARSFLGVPLLTGENVVGVLAVQDENDPYAYNENDLRLLSTVASQLAIAIENARLYNESQQNLRESLTLRHVSATIASSLEVNDILSTVTDELAHAFDYPFVRIYLVANGNLQLVAQSGEGEPTTTERIMPAGLLEQVMTDQHARLLSDVSETPDAPLASTDITSQICVPLIVERETLGVIDVESTARRPLTEKDLVLLKTIGQQVSVALERARLFEQLTRNAQELELRVIQRTIDLETERDRVETLLRITTELSASLDLDRVLTKALTLVKDSIDASQGSLFLIDSASDRIIYRAALGSPKPLPPGGVPVPFQRGEGLIGWVLEKRLPTIIGNLDEDERWIRRPFSHVHKSAMAVPLKASEDLLGALIFYSDDYNAFNQSQLNLVTAAASQVAAAISNAELYRLIRDQAERLGSMLRTNQIEVSKNRAILESVADGVLVADENGIAIVFNRAAEEILGLNRDTVIGRPTSEFLSFYGQAGQSWLHAINRWQQAPEDVKTLEVLAERLLLEDNRIVSVLLSPVFNGDEFIGSVSLFRDITREVEVDRLKTEFVTTVSHELRTPMTSIKGFTDLLLLGAAGPISDPQREFITKIKSNADRLKLLVEDLLDISKIEAGKIELRFEPLDLTTVLRTVANHVEGRIHNEGKALQLVVHMPDTLPLVRADHSRITQVITNLTDNAYNYTPAGGTITLEASAQDDGVQINVIDTGIGLSPEAKRRVFERFFRDENPFVMATAGTGLGLNIVLRLVEMHGGRIWADSPGEDQGSTFSVWLPLHPDIETETTQETQNA
mgnify:CR=1 FL=1